MKQAKNDSIIKISNVTKVFDGVTVLSNINLSIKKGQFITLLGPSGCGKTTLLRMIAGFETPTSGQIMIENQDVTNIPPYNRPVNTVFQKYALFPHLNVYKNIAFGLKLKKLPKKEIDEKVNRALKLVDLEGYGHRNVSTLSGGQQQRIAIARALVCEPKVLLLDEPLGALDLKMRKEMQIELMRMHKELGITFIYVTHDQEEALTMSDEIIVLNDGEIQQIGTPKKIYDEPSNAFVANFIGESNIISGIMKQDYSISFLNHTFECVDKGFEKNQPVDIIIRPEDIAVYSKDSSKGGIKGIVTSTVFKGTYYQMEITANNYEFTVQSTKESSVGEKVLLHFSPNSIHVMRKMKTTNEFIGEVSSNNTVYFVGRDFEFVNTNNLSKGDKVKIKVGFKDIEITDDEKEGTVGCNITQSLYKGSYYSVQLYTDTDEDFFVDTIYEWNIDDRVGIKIAPEKLIVEKIVEGGEDEKI